MNDKNPRWINENPGNGKIVNIRELTEKEKQEAKDFEKAILSGKINEWFNKK